MKVARESWVLGGICAADLATTLWLVDRCGATEANSLMRYYLHLGYLPFIAAKSLLVLGPLIVLEWARRRRPVFVQSMLRCAIVLYVGLYSGTVWNANRSPSVMDDRVAIEMLADWAGQPITPLDVDRARGTAASVFVTGLR